MIRWMIFIKKFCEKKQERVKFNKKVITIV